VFGGAGVQAPRAAANLLGALAMATTLISFDTTTKSIPAQAGKIIQVHRILVATTGSIFGTQSIRLCDDQNQDLIPPLPLVAGPTDISFPREQPQGNRGQAVVLEASTVSSFTHMWIEYRYVD
jgi:hypothetical protein